MIEHLVLFQWKTDASPEAIARVMNELRALQSQIPGIRDMTCGTNFSARSQGYTHALVIRFEDRAALEAYGPHPAHQRVVQEFIGPIRVETLVMDYEVE